MLLTRTPREPPEDPVAPRPQPPSVPSRGWASGLPRDFHEARGPLAENSNLGGILDPEVRRGGGERRKRGRGRSRGRGRDRTGRAGWGGWRGGAGRAGSGGAGRQVRGCGRSAGSRAPRSGRPVWLARGMSQGPPAGSVLQRSVAAPGNQPQVVDTGAGCGEGSEG